MKVVNLEQAKQLKDLGFNELVNYYFHYYPNCEDELKYRLEFANTGKRSFSNHSHHISAPYVSQSLNWLADEKGLDFVPLKSRVAKKWKSCLHIEERTISNGHFDKRADCEEALLELIFNHKEKLGL